MPTIYLKALVAVVILIAAIVGGLIPILLKTNERGNRWLVCAEAFSGGIFLGVGIIHFLPEALKQLNTVYQSQYPTIFAICAFSILVLYLIKEGTAKLFCKSAECMEMWMAYLLTIILSIHSIIEGAALGIEMTIAAFIMIFVAIISHKSSAAFALGIKMRGTAMRRKTQVKLMVLFSLMTPIGVLLGSVLIALLKAHSARLTVSIFDAVAAGTFIYIGTFHATHTHFKDEGAHFYKLFFYALGLVLMATVAIWL